MGSSSPGYCPVQSTIGIPVIQGNPIKLLGSTKTDPKDDFDCCCDICKYEFCIVNSNFVKDNSWDVYLNDNLLGNYSGAPNTNICLSIDKKYLILEGKNSLKFTRTSCVNDDLFEFEVRKICSEVITLLFSGSSGYLNGSFYSGKGGVCTDKEFTRDFSL